MKIYWCLLLLFFTTNNYAQPNNWVMLNGEQSANNLFIKDSLVFIARHNFDGVSIVNLNQENHDLLNQFNGKLPDDQVYQTLTDNVNTIWIRHLKAITIRTGNSNSYFSSAYFGFPISFSSPNIGNMSIDHNQNVWFCLGSSVINFDGQNYHVYDAADCPVFTNWMNELVIDEQNNVWVAANNNIAKFDGSNWIAYYGDSIGITFPITNLRHDRMGNIWFLEGGSRLKKFDGTSATMVHFFNGGIYCPEFEIDSMNNVWALNLSFLWDDPALLLKRNGSSWDTITIDDPKIIHGINHFVPVAPDDIFLGTWEGIYRFKAGNYYRYLINDTLLTNGGVGKVFTSVNSNKIWITSSRGLIEWEDNNPKHYKEKGKYFNDPPDNSYFLDKHDSLWIFDYFNFCRYSQWQDSIWGEQCMDSTFPSSHIAFDTLNGIWTSPRYLDSSLLTIIPLHYFNRDTIIYYPQVTSMSALIATDSKNNLWVLKGDSLAKFDGSSWTWRAVPHPVTFNNSIPTFHVDLTDKVYINYGSVLLSFDGTNFSTINVPDSFVLNNLIFSKDSSVWGVIYTQAQFVQHMKNFVLRYKNGVWDSLFVPVYGTDLVLIKDVAIDKYGNMWFVTNHDLSNRNTKLFVYNPQGLNHYLNTEDLLVTSDSKIYPNPCNDVFFYNFTAIKSEKVLLRIYDLNGALVFEDYSKRCEAGSNTIAYSIKHIHSGMYLTVVSSETYRSVKKLFITGNE